ncbi:MAG: calcium/sodium antiporter [Lachnospiraceae bacterium]|nr:calcium/sodium antiporter [Lachnospiraceae bacterium]MDY4969373.1 calcium/sodium antiporter [Lachnospiraceae bacterium]
MEILINFILLVVGFAMLVKGADWFVEGAAGIAAKFGIPQLIIGLTIVAMGTSAPEAAVSITAATKGTADITIGNIVGSNIMNVLIILGVASAITTMAVAESTVRYEIPFMIAMSVLLLVLGFSGNEITFVEGIILWIAFIAYFVYLFIMAKKNKEADQEEFKDRPWWQLILLTVIGLVLIVWGSDVTVNAATAIARIVGLSERIIGLTIVALGTSLPELFTSVMAARKHNADIAIGNIVGSNLFNILFVVGTSALVTNIPFAPNFRIDMLIAIAAAVLLWWFCFNDRKLKRNEGLVMLACYAGYFIYLMV